MLPDKAEVTLADDPPLYRDLMRFKPNDLTPNGWAVRAGVSRTVWSDMRRHGNPSRRTLEKLLEAAGSSLAEFEALRVGGTSGVEAGEDDRLGDASGSPWRPAPVPLIPVFACSAAVDWGAGSGIDQMAIDRSRIVDRIERPRSLVADREAYALTVVGDAMCPRFRPGKHIIVSPLAQVEIGDDIVIILREGNGTLALVKEMTRRDTRSIELRQHNPDLLFTIAEAVIAAIHKVIGEAI